ncbi:MAG: hypothetical protein IJ640_00815 [Prevotella sp.]|nr:hypothetical protein [Prevotella sp.]
MSNKTKYISAAQAAQIAGVTTQTIRNLCKAGTLSYRKHGNLFYPSREEVEQHAATIKEVQTITTDIEQYRQQLSDESCRLKNELQDMQVKYHERMANLEMFPQRIEVIKETLKAVVEGMNRYTDYTDCILTKRDIEITWDALQGKTFEEIGEGQRPSITKAGARVAWHTALRRFAHAKGAFYHLNSENDTLKEKLREKNEEIAMLHAQLDGRIATANEMKMSRLLAQEIRAFDISVRCLNVLRYAEIYTVRDLVRQHRRDLLKQRNFGKKSLIELDEFLENHGLAWAMNVDSIPEFVE